MLSKNKAGKERATVRESEGIYTGVVGGSDGARKTHSSERTHILDSKVALTHHMRNDAGCVYVCVCIWGGGGVKESGEEGKTTFPEVRCFPSAAPLLQLYQAVYKLPINPE